MATVVGLLTTGGCVQEGVLVQVPATLMQYQHKPTEARLLALAHSYAEAINSNLQQQAPCPGQYADYGVALARLGCLSTANVMFNNEKFFFPNSTLYVDVLKATLTPSYKDDHRIDTSMIDLMTLDTITVRLTPEEEALRRQQEEDPAYKQMMKERAKAERDRQKQLNREKKALEEKARREERKAQQEALKARREAEKAARKAEKQQESKDQTETETENRQ